MEAPGLNVDILQSAVMLLMLSCQGAATTFLLNQQHYSPHFLDWNTLLEQAALLTVSMREGDEDNPQSAVLVLSYCCQGATFLVFVMENS